MWSQVNKLTNTKCNIHQIPNDDCVREMWELNLEPSTLHNYYKDLQKTSLFKNKDKCDCLYHNVFDLDNNLPAILNCIKNDMKIFKIENVSPNTNMVCRYVRYHRYYGEVRKYINKKNNTDIYEDMYDLIVKSVKANDFEGKMELFLTLLTKDSEERNEVINQLYKNYQYFEIKS